MKKNYMNPKTTIVGLNIQHQLLSGSDKTFNLTGAGSADAETQSGGWNSRGTDSLWDDDDF